MVLLPAVVAVAAAVAAQHAAAASADPRWEGRRHTSHAVRHQGTWEAPARPRKRAGRAGLRRAGYRPRQASGRHRVRAHAAHTRRGRRHRVQAARRPAAAGALVARLPLQQRSLVAGHPLFPDVPLFAVPERAPAGATAPAPRCTSAHPNVFALLLGSLTPGLQVSEPAMVEGAWPHCRGASHPQSRWRLASLGRTGQHPPHPSDMAGLTDWPIHWRASADCLASPLRAILDLVAGEFGPLTVNSTCRSPSHNRRVGGAPRSYHLTGNAVDFRVRDRYGEVLSFLKKMRTVGGLSHYGAGVFHIDTGPRRTWRPGSWSHGRVRMARRG